MNARVRRFSAVTLAAALAAGSVPQAQSRTAAVPKAADDRTIVHVLNRLGFGPSRASLEHVRRVGIAAYIDEQLRPDRIDDAAMTARLSALATLSRSSLDLADEYFVPAMQARREQQRAAASGAAQGDPAPDREMRTPAQMEMARAQRAVIGDLSQQKVLRAAYSERQLEEVLVDFWFNHFNVFVGKGPVRIYLTEYERDVIRPNVLGRFRDLLSATARSPAMLFYLDNWQSTAAPDAPTAGNRPAARPGRVQPRQAGGAMEARRRIREMQQQMAPQRPAARQRRGLNENYARELMELHTLGVDGGYTQKDVQEVARAFTGWTIANPRRGGGFRFEPGMHDDGDKVVLGQPIKAGGGQQDGERVLDILAAHPSTARFIATKLARRFVADNPPPALVARAAERFRQTGGDIREVVRVIVSSREFFAPEAYRAKVKSPLEFVVSSVRAAGIDVRNALPLVQAVRDLGMPLYGAQPPTGYPDKAEAWINSGALLNRMNFAIAVTSGQMRGLGATWEARPATADAARRQLFDRALAGDVSASTNATVAKAATVPQALALVLGSPEFQKH